MAFDPNEPRDEKGRWVEDATSALQKAASDKKVKVAKDLKVGTKFKDGKTIQEVTKIVKVTGKTIEFRTRRIFPDYYEGNFFQRKTLNTPIESV